MTKPSYEERELGDARIALDAEYDAALKEYNSRPLHAGLFPSRRQWLETLALELHAELARVRGLLQRQQDLLSEARENLMAVHISGAITSGSNLAGMCGLNAQAITRFKEETAPMRLKDTVSDSCMDGEHESCDFDGHCDCGCHDEERSMSQGAESADIGKLDSADELGVEMGKVSRVEEKADV